MRVLKMAIYSVLIGVAITLVSGALFNNLIFGDFPNLVIIAGKSGPIPGVGYWGYILPWLKQIVTWPTPPKTIVWPNLIIDVLIWSVIPFLLSLVLFRERETEWKK